MPNYCSNNLRITGASKEVVRFYNAITAGELKEWEQFRILDNLFPTPKELTETPSGSFGDTDKQKQVEAQNKANIAKFGYKDWYDWNCANYGSKWSDFDGVINLLTEDTLELAFMSAWSPITNGIIHVSKQFPTLDFVLTYEEGGMGFMGGIAVKNGEVLSEVEDEYPNPESDDDEDFDKMFEAVAEKMGEMQEVLEQAF